jgi:hypothetical protein
MIRKRFEKWRGRMHDESKEKAPKAEREQRKNKEK